MQGTIYSVGQLNTYVKNMFSQDYLLRSLSVKGEVSNCKYHSSGHIYFTLKDETGSIAAVMFAGNARGLTFRMQDGQCVVVKGNVDIYERDGKYQLYAKQITLDGAGALYERYEQLKAELMEEGMFDVSYKLPIPSFVKTLGVVTAPTGAAVRDIINVATRRNPYVQIVLYPALVQGAEASASIVQGIKALERLGVDAMIVGRGGGSIEDLWAFNEREVAQAVFDCSIPIISAVGHETDTTIIDYVADMRAPTPSAAAEIAVQEFAPIEMSLVDYEQRLHQAMERAIGGKRQELAHVFKQLQLLSPEAKIRRGRENLIYYEDRLSDLMNGLVQEKKHKLALLGSRLDGRSPLKRLQDGYAFVADEEGKKITSVEQVSKDQLLQLYVTDGAIQAKVTGYTEKTFA